MLNAYVKHKGSTFAVKLSNLPSSMTKLDWYIIRKFITSYVFSIALIIVIIVVFDIKDKVDNFLDHDAPLKSIIVDYYFNFVPYYAGMLSALFVFISVIFFTSKLADNSEIIAMQSCGMSFTRLVRPYFIAAALMAGSNFALSAYVIPRGNETRLDFENTYVKKKKKDYVTNIQLQVEKDVIAYIERYEVATGKGYNFSLDKFKDKQLVSHLTASSIDYIDTGKVKFWHIRNYTLRRLVGVAERMTQGAELDTVLNMSPADFMLMEKTYETMTSPQLSEYVRSQQSRGVAGLAEFEIEWHKRIAASFAAFILTLIGLCLSSRKIKGGMGINLGIGLALSFGYILFQTFSATFSVSGGLPPMLAVWLPNIVFAIVALLLYMKRKKT